MLNFSSPIELTRGNFHVFIRFQLLTITQCSAIISMAIGFSAGILSSLLSLGLIVSTKFREVSCLGATFMFIQILSAILCFASWFAISTLANEDIDRLYPGVSLSPSYSAYLAVCSAGAVIIGFITMSCLGRSKAKSDAIARQKATEEYKQNEDYKRYGNQAVLNP